MEIPVLDTTSYQALLSKDVKVWRSRITELSGEIAIKEKERNSLLKKVDAAMVLLGPDSNDADSASELGSIRTLIDNLMFDGAIRRPKDMRRDLIAKGVDPERVSSSTGNFYNAIAQLVDSGALERDEESRYWNPKKSSGPEKEGML
jgi:hypothetical protein